MRFYVTLLFTMLLMTFSINAAEAAGDGDWTLDGWKAIFSFEGFWSLLAMAVTAGFGWVFKKLGDLLGKLKGTAEQREARQQALEALETGVNETYEDFVKHAKKAASDGKLTEAERKEARDLAVQRALGVAKGAGLELLKATAKPILDAWIEKILRKIKGEKKD